MGNKAILFNSPKSCGKDVAIEYLIQNLSTKLVRRECKDLLHKLTMLFFCVPEQRYWGIYNDRSLKEVPLPEFTVEIYSDEYEECFKTFKKNLKRVSATFTYQLSIREAMIYISEIVCKPRMGLNYFGKARAASILPNEVIIDGSCGFEEELQPLIDQVGNGNILLLRIHREGYGFDGDSRSYIEDGVLVNTVDIYNDGTEQEYFDKVLAAVKGFLDD